MILPVSVFVFMLVCLIAGIRLGILLAQFSATFTSGFRAYAEPALQSRYLRRVRGILYELLQLS